MKNIHVLPTDKPSRLYLFKKRLILGDLKTVVFKNSGAVNQNIYITSDEEIKEGDWYFDGTNLVHKKTKYNDALVDGNKNAKKIILTTDQDLINDGVQAIDNEFLEFFVKNPSCESVEVDKGYRGVDLFNYKIIIPKPIKSYSTRKLHSETNHICMCNKPNGLINGGYCYATDEKGNTVRPCDIGLTLYDV